MVYPSCHQKGNISLYV